MAAKRPKWLNGYMVIWLDGYCWKMQNKKFLKLEDIKAYTMASELSDYVWNIVNNRKKINHIAIEQYSSITSCCQ